MVNTDNAKRELSRTRRTYLKYAGLAVSTGLAGCLLNGDGSGDSGSGDNGSGDSGSGDGGSGTGTTSDSDSKKLTIGSNHPLSGPLAYTGISMQRAIELAVRQKNEAGGIESLGGMNVEVIKGDNQGKQSVAGQVSQQLIQDGADVLTGCFSSDATLAATAVAERERVPFVISVAASDRILKGQKKYVYRPQPTTFHYARDWAKYYPKLVRDAGYEIKTVGHYYTDNVYGAEIHNYLKDTFLKENGMEMIESTSISLQATDASAQVTKIKQADPDCLCFTGYSQDAILLFKALNNLNYRPKWLSASANVGLVSPDQVKKIGKPARSIMDANYALNHNVKVTDKFMKNYDEYANRAATPESALAWVATRIILDGVERAGSLERDAINKALQKTELSRDQTPLAMDGVTFEKSGENKLALAAMNQVRTPELAIKVVYPERFAQMPPRIEPGKT